MADTVPAEFEHPLVVCVRRTFDAALVRHVRRDRERRSRGLTGGTAASSSGN